MKSLLQNSFFTRRVYLALTILVGLMLLSYGINFLFQPTLILVAFFMVLMLLDFLLLFLPKAPLKGSRIVPARLSNGDDNIIRLRLSSVYPFPVQLQIIDEIPVQFQARDFVLKTTLQPGEEKALSYVLRPVERGLYNFFDINILVASPFLLVKRQLVIPAQQFVKVMPAFLTLKKYALLAVETNLAESGNRKMRKLGHSLEFEQIRDYVTGDDVRSINWQATARKGGQLMVNSFVDERSQQVYCIIDKSRAMKMPFEGMTLLDYAINASLILSQVAIIKYDKAGLITFDENMGKLLVADRKRAQMGLITEMLYNQQTNFLEGDFEQLQVLVRTKITQRSLVVLFTNFESMPALERQLPYIRNLARYHLVLVVFFENTALAEITGNEVNTMEQLYIKTIAEKFLLEKRQMVKELYKYGILSLLTAPKNVTVNTVNKYLELKTRQVI
jgi:uncharacterized protein (DUF58 family)